MRGSPSTFSASASSVPGVVLDTTRLRLSYSLSSRNASPRHSSSTSSFRDSITVAASEPFDPGSFYVEFTIASLPPSGFISIGMCTADTFPDQGVLVGRLPGELPRSLGLLSSGELLSTLADDGAAIKIPLSAPFGELDTVGLGFKDESRRVFFTLNGKDQGMVALETSQVPRLAACGFDSSSSCIVDANFGHKRFLYEPHHALPSSPPPPLELEPFVKKLFNAQPEMGPRAWTVAEHGVVKLGRKLSNFFSPGTSARATTARLEADLLEAKDTVAMLTQLLNERDSTHQDDDVLMELSLSCRKLLVRHANLVQEAPNAEILNRVLLMNDRLSELLAAADSLLKSQSSSLESDSLSSSTNAETVSRMLHLLRAGDALAQKNAATCLGRLVKDESNLSIVLSLSGVHALVVKTKETDAEMRIIAATALATLASRLKETHVIGVAHCFGNELSDVLTAFGLVLEPEPLLVAKAIVSLSSVLAQSKTQPEWLERMIELGVPLLLSVLQNNHQTLLPLKPVKLVRRESSSSHRRSASWSHFEPVPESEPLASSDGNEVERTVASGLALLAKQPRAQSTLVAIDNFFPSISRLLSSPDPHVCLFGAATLGGLFASNDEDAFTRGFVAAQVLQSNVLEALIALAQTPSLPETTRGWVSLCITNLASHPSSRQALTQFGVDKCVDACLRLLARPSSPADSWHMDEVRLSGALLHILRLRPVVPSETFARPGSLDTVLTLALSDNRVVVRNATDILVLLSRSPGCWGAALPALVRLMGHGDEQVRVAAAAALADVCNAGDPHVRMCALQAGAAVALTVPGAAPPHIVCRGLEGLAQIVFSPNWDDLPPRASFFGFGTKGNALPFLVQAVGQYGADPVAALEAMHALATAVKARGALATHYRVECVRSALPHAAAVLTRGTAEASLRHAAEGLLNALGFSVADLQVSRAAWTTTTRALTKLLPQLVANDAQLLSEWARMHLDVRMSLAIDFCVAKLASAAWPHMADPPSVPSFPFFDSKIDVTQPDDDVAVRKTGTFRHHSSSSSQGQVPRWTHGGVKAAVSDLASAPPGEFLKVLAEGLGQSSVYERVQRELSGVSISETPKKELAVKTISALIRAATPTSPDAPPPPDTPRPRDWYELCFAVSAFSPARFGLKGFEALPSLVLDLIAEQVPGSRLAQALSLQPVMFLELNGGGGGPMGLIMPSRARSLILNDARRHIPAQILPRLVQDAPESVLADFPGLRFKSEGRCTLVLRNSQLGGDAPTRLVDALFRAPSLTCIAFTRGASGVSTPEEEETFAALVGDLPPSVTQLVFDRCLTPAGLRLVVAFLGQRRQIPSLLAFCNLGLQAEDMEPVLRFSVKASMSPTSSMGSLRHLDLGGNALSDLAVGSLLRQLARPECSLQAIHLNDNYFALGKDTVDSLLGWSHIPPGKQARGEARVLSDGLLAVPSLRRLSLARSHLSAEGASRLLYALAKKIEGNAHAPSLVVLDLDGNGFKSPDVSRALVSCVAFNPHLREIDFAGNDVGDVQYLVQALELNQSMQILRCDVAVDDVHTQALERVLNRNRFDWRGKEGQAGEFQDAGDEPRALAGGGHDLFVLFSSPLCWRDHEGRLRPLDRLDHEAERELLLQSFAEAQSRVGTAPAVHFDFGTTDTLMSVLTRRPAALHWSGHGTPAYVALEDGRGGMHAVSTEQLAQICASARHEDLKLVVVSACSSRTVAEAFAKAGVKHVVAVESGMQVLDKAAQLFSRAFYLSLAMGDSVEAAFLIGKEAVKSAPNLNGERESEKFVLLGDGDHRSEVVFPRRRRPLVPRALAPFPSPIQWRGLNTAALGASDQPIVGRAVDVYLVLVALLSRRLVSITGIEGVGKSQLCAFVARYLNDRRIFEDGVVCVDCSRAKTVGEVVDCIHRLIFGEMQVDARGWRTPTESVLAELTARRAVLVLDHVDGLEKYDDFRLFLGAVLDRTKGLRIMVIVHSKPGLHLERGGVPGHDELVHELGALAPIDAARLFLRCSPHFHADCCARPDVFVHFEKGLARHPTLVRLKGIPRDVARAAALQSDAEWACLVEEVTEGGLVGMKD